MHKFRYFFGKDLLFFRKMLLRSKKFRPGMPEMRPECALIRPAADHIPITGAHILPPPRKKQREEARSVHLERFS